MSTPSSVLAASCKQGTGGVSLSSSLSVSTSAIMPGSSTSSCSGKHSREIPEISPATKRKALDAETHHGTQHASNVSIAKETPEHEQHNLLEALVPVNLELPSQRNSILESDESTGDGQTGSKRGGEALELLLSKGQELLEQAKRKGEVKLPASSSSCTIYVFTSNLCVCCPLQEKEPANASERANANASQMPTAQAYERFLPAKKRKTLDAGTHHGAQHATNASITKKTPEHEQHSLLEALVPVKVELPSQCNSMLESDESTGDGQTGLMRAGDALELLLSKGQELLEQDERQGKV